MNNDPNIDKEQQIITS